MGDPGAEVHFQGVALTRGNDTVTPEDEATAIHLVNEIIDNHVQYIHVSIDRRVHP